MTPERKARFLENLRKCGNVATAAEMTDGNPNTRRSYQVARAKDPRFAKEVDDALESFAAKVSQVLNEEFFEGQLTPVVSMGNVVSDPRTGEPIYIRKRDPRLVVKYASKFDPALKDSSGGVNVTVNNGPAEDPQNPSIRIFASDLHLLDSHQSETLLGLLNIIRAKKNVDGPALPAPDRDEFEDVEFEEVEPGEDLEDSPDREPQDSESGSQQREPWE